MSEQEMLKEKVASLTGEEHPDFDDLSKDELKTLHQIRHILALDALGYKNAEIERTLGMKPNELYGIRGNHAVLWSMAETDFIRRMRLLLDAVNESISELLSDGEMEMLWKLRQISRGGKQRSKIPGRPSLTLTPIKGDITPGNVVSAAMGFLKFADVFNQRVMGILGAEEAAAKGLKRPDDAFARRVAEDREKANANRLVKKNRKATAKRVANHEARSRITPTEKDLLGTN